MCALFVDEIRDFHVGLVYLRNYETEDQLTCIDYYNIKNF